MCFFFFNFPSSLYQDPDVINTPLPVEHSATTEDDGGRVIRPSDHTSTGLTPLLVSPHSVSQDFPSQRGLSSLALGPTPVTLQPTKPCLVSTPPENPARPPWGDVMPWRSGAVRGRVCSRYWFVSSREPEAEEQDDEPVEPHVRLLGFGKLQGEENSRSHSVYAALRHYSVYNWCILKGTAYYTFVSLICVHPK